VIKIPFGKYKDFAACVRDQKTKGFSEDRAKRICATIHKKITGKWPTEASSMKEELARGDGRGVGGPRQGIGPTKYCKCTKCGYKMKHIPDHPCTDYVCPKCSGSLVGRDK